MLINRNGMFPESVSEGFFARNSCWLHSCARSSALDSFACLLEGPILETRGSLYSRGF